MISICDADAVVWGEHESRDENPVMSSPIKKGINTELFIETRAALYVLISESEIKG